MVDIVQKLLFLETEDCVRKTAYLWRFTVTLYHIYNALYAPLLCKRGMMKRMLSLRNGIPAAPPPPHGHECCWRCSAAHWRKIPSTPILLSWHTWPFDISCVSSLHLRDGQGDAKGACQNLFWNSFSFLVNWEFCGCKNYRLCFFQWTQWYLMEDINYWHSIIFLTVSVHFSWPFTFWAYLTTLYCSTFINEC